MKTTYTGPDSGVITFEQSFRMTGYRYNGEAETLEIRYNSKHYSIFLVEIGNPDYERQLIGSEAGPFRVNVHREIVRRGINATEKY